MLDQFKEEIVRLGLDKLESEFAVALSGGSDSLALSLLLNECFPNKTTSLTVNHNLRDESTQEANEVQRNANALGLNHKILEWKHEDVSSNIHETARHARYDLLTGYCKAHSIKYLFVGHNKEDVAETFLINMFRGSGIYGLSSIPTVTIYNDIKIIRPLLNFRKQELRDYLLEKKCKWIEDPSNFKDRFLRTKIRKLLQSSAMSDIISDPDLLIDRLALNAKNIARARVEIENLCNDKIAQIVTLHEEGYLTINYRDFVALGEEVALKILCLCLITISGRSTHQPRLEAVQRLYESIMLHSTKAKTLCGCEVVLKKDLIFVYREIGKEGLIFKKTSDHAWIWDDRFKIAGKKASMVKAIESPSFEDIKEVMHKKYKNIPRKVWKSLPLIITYDNRRYVPFLNSGVEEGFGVEFIPKMSLGRTSFFD